MDDRELLRLAAKAANGFGMCLIWGRKTSEPEPYWMHLFEPWNPLTDDGDALRLANVLHLCVCHTLGGVVGAHGTAMVGMSPWENSVPLATERYGGDGDICVATRRAIVRAAAEIGAAMP